MALTKSEARTSRLIFYAAAIVAVLYGLLFLSLPEWALQLSQDPGAPKDAGWLRWSGAFLIGIALAAWLAATQPDRQRALVVGLALSYLLVALSLLYSTISGEYQGAQWFIWVPILINLAFTAAMIWLITKQLMPGGRYPPILHVGSPLQCCMAFACRTSHICSMATWFTGEEGGDSLVTRRFLALCFPLWVLGWSHKPGGPTRVLEVLAR